MTRLNDQYGGGIDPLQDHSPGAAQVLQTRLTRYAARLVDVDPDTRPVIGRGTEGDLLCSTMWSPSSRPIAGWAHAWPVVGGSTVASSGFSASAVDGALLSKRSGVLSAGAGGGKGGSDRGTRGTSLRIGIDAGGDFTVLGGQGLPRTFGLPSGVFLGIDRQPTNFGGTGPAGAIIYDATGYFSAAALARKDAIRDGWRPGGVGPGGSVGAAGGLGAAGAAGPYGASGVGVITSEAAPEPVDYNHLPIRNGLGVSDGTFKERQSSLPIGYPAMPLGAVGVSLGGTEHRGQENVYVHGDPRLVSVNNGPDHRASSIVFDTDGRGAYDLGRWARFHSAWRVAPQLMGDLDFGRGGTLAWQLARGERDGVAGMGAVVDLGSLRQLSAPAVTPSAAVTPSSVGGGGAALAPLSQRQYGNDKQMFGAIASAGTEAAIERNRYVYTRPTDKSGASAPDERRAVARDEPRLTVALMSARQGGPLEVGHAKKDKHKVGTSGEWNVNLGHLACSGAFYADPLRDGPLYFERLLFTKAENFPVLSHVHLVWDNGTNPTIPGDGKVHRGVWRWIAEVPTMSEGGKPPASPPPTTPPPGKPPLPPWEIPIPPPTYDPPTTPGSPVLPRNPRQLPRRMLAGMSGGAGGSGVGPGDIGAGGGGPGSGVMYRGPRHLRTPGAVQPADPIGGIVDAGPPEAPYYVAQRTTASGWTDGVTGFAAQSAHTALLFRPQEVEGGAVDLRSNNRIPYDVLRPIVADRPMTARLEAWGARDGGAWAKTQRTGNSRYEGGTAPGGLLLLPPEYDMLDVKAGSSPVAASASYLAAYPGTYIGWGKPILSTGGLGTGYRAGTDGSGVLSIQRLTSTGTATTVFGGNASAQFQIREGGGTLLTFSGVLSDGQYLKRNGTALEGATPTAASSLDCTVTTYGGGSSGNHSPGGSTRVMRVRCWGGGGGGGGADSGATSAGVGAGGGAGGYSEKVYSLPSGTYAYSVGGGGSGGSAGNNAGAAGGDTTFSGMTAKGGTGGGSFAAAAAAAAATATGGGYTSGTSGGDINVEGGGGFNGFKGNTLTALQGGAGASSSMGGGAQPPAHSGGAGNSASTYGSGGSGAVGAGGGGTQAGGSGSGGLIIIEEWE